MTVDDPVFGKLEWNRFFWEGKISLPEIGWEADLSVDRIEDEPPDDAQREIFRHFVSRCDATLLMRIEDALFGFVEMYRTMDLLDRPRKIIDAIQAPADVWPTMSAPTIFVPVQYEGAKKRLHIQWIAKWDDCHGIQVLYREDGEMCAQNIGDDYFDDD